MADKKNMKLISLATGNKKTIAKKEVVIVKKTPEEERDIRAKLTVEKLLEGTSLIPKEKEKLIEIDTEVIQPEGAEWLQEQVGLLSSENENLRIELATARDNYSKILGESQRIKGNNPNELLNETITQNILTLFNELQNNLLGHNAERTVWTTANIPVLLKKMLLMFPFTADIKKF